MTFKQRLQSGEAVHGCWLNLGSHVSAEIVGLSGFDWVLIDLEHGAGSMQMMLHQVQALAHCAVTPIVRIDEISRPKVQQILDVGAQGVMFPQVKTTDEAAKAVSAMYYPPQGTRGLARMVRAGGFGKTFDEYHNSLQDRLVGVIQIETLESLDNLDTIAALDGVDVLFVGPSDLTMVMGIYGQFLHPDYLKAVEKVADTAKNAGKACGVLLLDINHYEIYYKLGYRFMACGADSTFVVRGAQDMSSDLKRRASAARQ